MIFEWCGPMPCFAPLRCLFAKLCVHTSSPPCLSPLERCAAATCGQACKWEHSTCPALMMAAACVWRHAAPTAAASSALQPRAQYMRQLWRCGCGSGAHMPWLPCLQKQTSGRNESSKVPIPPRQLNCNFRECVYGTHGYEFYGWWKDAR
jgi:hypothetical protein